MSVSQTEKLTMAARWIPAAHLHFSSSRTVSSQQITDCKERREKPPTISPTLQVNINHLPWVISFPNFCSLQFFSPVPEYAARDAAGVTGELDSDRNKSMRQYNEAGVAETTVSAAIIHRSPRRVTSCHPGQSDTKATVCCTRSCLWLGRLERVQFLDKSGEANLSRHAVDERWNLA